MCASEFTALHSVVSRFSIAAGMGPHPQEKERQGLSNNTLFYGPKRRQKKSRVFLVTLGGLIVSRETVNTICHDVTFKNYETDGEVRRKPSHKVEATTRKDTFGSSVAALSHTGEVVAETGLTYSYRQVWIWNKSGVPHV